MQAAFEVATDLMGWLVPLSPVMSHALVLCFVFYMMLPHPGALSRPQVNMTAVRNANWKQVKWEEHVKEMKTGKKYAVVGAGFLGRKIIHSLLLRGETNVKAFDADRNACETLLESGAKFEFTCGNVCDYDSIRAFVEGADVVYATFALIRFMESYEHLAKPSYKVNVEGTETLVRACADAGVKLLIQTSTSNVSVAEEYCSFSMDEKTGYVTRENAPNHYGWTKALAEQIVLKANGLNGMRTVAVRPCSAVFGADDRHMVEIMLNLGRIVLPPNGGSAVIDFVSIMNVVWGHFLAEKALWEDREGVAGEAFGVSNNAPMRLLDLCALLNLMRPGGITVIPGPERLLKAIASVLEMLTYFNIRMPGAAGMFTRTLCNYLDLSYVFSTRKAMTRLGYEPIFSMEDAMQMTVDEWQAGEILPRLSA